MFQSPDFYALDDLLTLEERDVRARVRAWVEERWMPIVAHHFREGTFPYDLVPELADLHAFGPDIRGYGLPGWGAVAYGLLMQELERGDSGLRTVCSVQGALTMQALARFGSEEQKERWLPPLGRGEKLGCFGLTEPGAGSNPAGMETRARPSGDGYVLDGTKYWIGNGTRADVAVIWAYLDDGIRGFLVDTAAPGFAATEITGMLSLRASVQARLELRECPAELLPGTEGLKSALTCLNQARFGIAWGSVGSAMACYEEARRHALSREQFGRPIAGFQLVQEKLARMLSEITKAQLLAFRLAQLKDAGRVTPAQISLAKMNNVETAREVARTARDILGGVGILDEHQCFRHMCNLESVRTYEGTHDVHVLSLGREITGLSAFS